MILLSIIFFFYLNKRISPKTKIIQFNFEKYKINIADINSLKYRSSNYQENSLDKNDFMFRLLTDDLYFNLTIGTPPQIIATIWNMNKYSFKIYSSSYNCNQSFTYKELKNFLILALMQQSGQCLISRPVQPGNSVRGYPAAFSKIATRWAFRTSFVQLSVFEGLSGYALYLQATKSLPVFPSFCFSKSLLLSGSPIHRRELPMSYVFCALSQTQIGVGHRRIESGAPIRS